jgi:hypothetical protein
MLNRYYKRKQQAQKLLGGVCNVCGTTDSLEFDHIDNSDKSFSISKLWNCSEKVFLEEIYKCQLLCHEHHKEKTKRNKEYRPAWPEPIHGKVWTYSGHGCRCELCKEAKRNAGRKH